MSNSLFSGSRQLGAGLSLLAAGSSALAAAPAPQNSANLFEKAVAVLRERYFEKSFREKELPALAAKYQPCAQRATSLDEQRDCVNQLLAHVPSSHLALLSEESFNYLLGELGGIPRPTFGLQLLRLGDDYYTAFVLEGGAAAQAGVVTWERVLAIDGQPVVRSPRLDYRQKDAYLPIDRDPPVHSLLCHEGDEISLLLEKTEGAQRTLKLRAKAYSAFEAARASARVIELDGHKIGYVHFWFIHSTGVLELMRELFADRFANAEGLVLDLRGRGGNGVVAQPLLEMLTAWDRPIVALTDRQSRSAKDALAYEFKQRHLAKVVGERTAGAVIPASFAPLGDASVLMFPSFTLGEYTEKLELKGGVEPDVFVERAGPFSDGRDTILDRGKTEMLHLLAESRPAKEPAVVSVTPPKPALVRPPTLSRKPLPPLATVIGKMVAALGGEDALRAHQHRMLTGTTEFIGLPLKGDFVQKASAPNKSLVVMHLGDLVVQQGFDGATAWSETSMNGLQILEGAAADAIEQQARFYGPLDLLAPGWQVTVEKFAPFDERECLELKIAGPHGGVSFLYLDAATYLPAGSKATIETPIGAVESKTYLRNYRTLDGFTTATEILIESSVQRQAIRIDRVSFDPIAASDFAVPKNSR